MLINITSKSSISFNYLKNVLKNFLERQKFTFKRNAIQIYNAHNNPININ